jgi:hypothetical protein
MRTDEAKDAGARPEDSGEKNFPTANPLPAFERP